MTVRYSTIRLGLIGAGRWGSNYVRTIQAVRDAVLARVSTERSDATALVGPECQIDRRWESLIDAGDLDGVIIATPPRLHYAMAHYAISNGLPALVEKPLTMDVTEARALHDLALERGIPMLVDHVYLYHPAYRALRRELADQVPLRIEGTAGNAGPYRPDTPLLWDYGPHDLAMCLDLTHEIPVRVNAERLDRKPVGTGFGETIQLHLAFASGAEANLSLSNLLDRRSRFLSVETGSQRLVFDDASETKLYRDHVDGSRPREPIEFVDEPPLSVAVREFVEAIKQGSPTEKDVDLATEVVVTVARCEATLPRPD